MKSRHLKICFIFLLLTALMSSCAGERNSDRRPLTNVRTFAGAGGELAEPFGVAVKADEIFVSDGENGTIKVFPAGAPAPRIFAGDLDTPSGIAFDEQGDLLVADAGTHTIKKIKANGDREIIAGTENRRGYADGAAATALFNSPIGIAVDRNKIYVADTYNDKIRVIENGRVTTLAGGSQGFADGAGISAAFDTPIGLAVWTDGRLLVADAGNRRIRVIETDGATWTLAGTGTAGRKDGTLREAEFVQPTAITVNSDGAVYVADGNSIRAVGARSFPFVETISSDARGFADGEILAARLNRPSGLAFDARGNLYVADSGNQVVRVFTGGDAGAELSADQQAKLRGTPAEFRNSGAPRWTYNPPDAKREIAGTLGEIRGEIAENKQAWFHNGLDIAGGFGETARFIRDGKVTEPMAAEGFGGLRERLRLATVGYIHIKLGRDRDDKLFDDARFQFSRDQAGKLNGVRVARGTKFKAGEAIGTLNAFNHVHLIAGRPGAEMNALDAFALPGIADTVAPIIEKVTVYGENWSPFETARSNSRIILNGKTRIVARAYDQMNGGESRRRLGVYKLGYQVLKSDKTPLGEPKWTISFANAPNEAAVKFVYAPGSQSGYTPQTIFNYIVSNEVGGEQFRESFFEADALENGIYYLRVFAADFFGNTSAQDINFEVSK